MILIISFALFFFTTLSAQDNPQQPLELALRITQDEMTLRSNINSIKRPSLEKYYKCAKNDPRWRTFKNLPPELKEAFFNSIRHIAINDPENYPTMRLYLAGCAYADCTVKTKGFDEERLIELIVKHNDVALMLLLPLVD